MSTARSREYVFVFLAPAVLGGLLGLVPHAAKDAAAYVERMRLLCLGSVLLGYFGVAFFVWRKSEGSRRWMSLAVGLLAVRVFYVPVLAVAIFLTGWLEWSAAKLGASQLSGPLHYALGCFLGATACFATLLAVLAANSLRHPLWALAAALMAGVAVLALLHEEDRSVLPHPFDNLAPSPSADGPSYLDVVKDEEAPGTVRLLALFGALRHYASPRSGWGGVVREELLAQFRGRPDASLRARVGSLERALLRARSYLRTSPRTPPG